MFVLTRRVVMQFVLGFGLCFLVIVLSFVTIGVIKLVTRVNRLEEFTLDVNKSIGEVFEELHRKIDALETNVNQEILSEVKNLSEQIEGTERYFDSQFTEIRLEFERDLESQGESLNELDTLVAELREPKPVAKRGPKKQ
jgi:uncharacterized protein (UPF0335 family)